MVVENAVSGTAPESTISVQLGRDLVTEMAMAYGLHRFHDHSMTTRDLWIGAFPSNGAIAMICQNNGLPSTFVNDPKHDGMLIA